MKKIFILSAFFLSSLHVFAQKGFHIGLDGSANLTFIINQNNWGRRVLQLSGKISF